MKLILGTVQLGIDYGINKKKPSLVQSLEILNYCIENNINTFDTAQDYGNCEEIISHISNKNVSIITKINFYSNEVNNTFEKILEKVQVSLTNLKINKLDTLLLHRFSDFLDKKLIFNLFKIKNMGLIDKIGVSVYTVEEAIEVLKDDRFTVIQLPFNYLDSQWKNSEFNLLLKTRSNVEIHVRSIFLQGILVNSFDFWPKINGFEFKPIYDNIISICKEYNLTKLELVIGYIKSIEWIDSVLFGVDNITQLKENIKLYKKTNKLNQVIIDKCEIIFKNVPKELVNPVLWK